MSRSPSAVSPERDRRLRLWQNVAMLVVALGVIALVYLAVAGTS